MLSHDTIHEFMSLSKWICMRNHKIFYYHKSTPTFSSVKWGWEQKKLSKFQLASLYPSMNGYEQWSLKIIFIFIPPTIFSIIPLRIHVIIITSLPLFQCSFKLCDGKFLILFTFSSARKNEGKFNSHIMSFVSRKLRNVKETNAVISLKRIRWRKLFC
jgi:hypothetical protein